MIASSRPGTCKTRWRAGTYHDFIIGFDQIRVRMSVRGKARYSWTELFSGLRHVSYLEMFDNVDVTRLLALSRYQTETGHFFDKNLVLKDWKMRFEELSCFYMFTSKGLDWTSGTPLAEGSATRTFRVQNEDGLMSFHVPTTKAIAHYCTNVWDLLRDSLRILKMKPYRPNFPIYLLILVQLLEDQILCWASADAWILFQAVCQTFKLSPYRGHCLLRLTSFKRRESHLSLNKKYPKHIYTL